MRAKKISYQIERKQVNTLTPLKAHHIEWTPCRATVEKIGGRKLHLEEKIEVWSIAHGQPRAYADSQDIKLVKFFDWRRVDSEDPKDWKMDLVPNSCRKWNTDEVHEKELVDRALEILGLSNARTKQERDTDTWFNSYLDYAKYIGPGEVEVRYVSPFVD